MIQYDLPRIPNQTISLTADGFDCQVTFQTFDGLLFATIVINGVTIKGSVRCVPNQFLIPYQCYAPEGFGNLRFECIDDNYPDFNTFNESCFLVYYSPDELNKEKK